VAVLIKAASSGVNTSRLPVLSKARMGEPFFQLKAGDSSVREKLVVGNTRLVLSVILRLNRRAESVDDPFQVGYIGLVEATGDFDLEQNVRLSIYTVPLIIGEIRHYRRGNHPIRVSRSWRDLAYKALQVRDRLVNRHAREPTVGEIATKLSCPVKR